MSAASPKILVVDDNADNRALARAALEDEGYAVATASDGPLGLAAFVQERPDCVLLDVRMPGLDGPSVCAEIRKLPGGSEVPIVFLTALRDVDTFDRTLAAGGDDFLTKPVRPTELVMRVQAALRLREMGAELRAHYELVRRQRDDLARLQLQKEQLTAFLVHDIKNPVATIDLHAQLLLRNRSLDDKARDSVERIRGDAGSALRLLLNLLDISRSDEEQLMPAVGEVDLGAMSAALLEAFESKARSKRIELQSAVETNVHADRDLLQRVLENLIDNAIRHTPEGGRVQLMASRHEHQVEIRVSDTGPGIPEHMRDRIFERFVQVEQRDGVTSRAGRGLGLTFCKLAVQAHGGSIHVESLAPGTAFCVRLARA